MQADTAHNEQGYKEERGERPVKPGNNRQHSNTHETHATAAPPVHADD